MQLFNLIKRLQQKNVSTCEAHSNFYTILGNLASEVRSSNIKSFNKNKIIFAGHSMGASAAIAASRAYSYNVATIAFTPCVYYDHNQPGLPNPTLLLETNDYNVKGKDLRSVCDWETRYRIIRTSSNQNSIYAKPDSKSHESSFTWKFSDFATDYLDCLLKLRSACSKLNNRVGWRY